MLLECFILISAGSAIAVDVTYPRKESILGIWPIYGGLNDHGPERIVGTTTALVVQGPFGPSKAAILNNFKATSSKLAVQSFSLLFYFSEATSGNGEGSIFEFQDSHGTNKALQARYTNYTTMELAANGFVIGRYSIVRSKAAWNFYASMYNSETISLKIFGRYGELVPYNFQPHVKASMTFNDNGISFGSSKFWNIPAGKDDAFACIQLYSAVLNFEEIIQAHDACRIASAALPCGTPKIGTSTQDEKLHCSASLIPKPGQFPWIAALKKSNGDLLCSAAVVDQIWLLTMAKCIDEAKTAEYYVTVGEYDLAVDEGHESSFNLSRVIVQPKQQLGPDQAEFALLELTELLNFGDQFVTDSCFMAIDIIGESDLNQPQIIHGWGKNGRTSLTSKTLPRYAYGAIRPDEECKTSWSSNSDFLGNNVNYCFDSLTWPCDGDEGDPVMVQSKRNTTNNGEVTMFIQTGLYYKRDSTCSLNKPALFAGLTKKQFQWVLDTITSATHK